MTSSARRRGPVRPTTMMQDVADHWGLVVAMGVVSIVLGMLAIVYPGATIVTVGDLLRRLAVRERDVSRSSPRSPATATRAAGSCTRSSASCRSSSGSRCCGRRSSRSRSFIFVLGIFWLVQGIMTFIAAFSRKAGTQLAAVQSGSSGSSPGSSSSTYPIASAVTLAFIGGIWLVILGVMQIVAGFRLRRRAASLATDQPRLTPVRRSGSGSVLSCRAAPTRRPRRPGRSARDGVHRSGVAQW